MTAAPARGVIALLTAQAVMFGVALALLLVTGNTLFLDAYGAKWLPATFVAIAVFGTAASALVARAARRARLVRVATATLLALAVVYAASWIVLTAGGVWVSAVLLVLLAVALQLGFVFIGGQAGRLLDVRQMKERFARVIAGFSVGFLLGGLLALPLLALLGSTEDLLVGATVAQLAFLGLLLETERRFPEVRSPAMETAVTPRPSARRLFASGIVLLLLVYQVLSAMGTWIVEYLFFNRAAAQYSGDELTRFLSVYMVLLNLTAILFLSFVAGPLMRRFGLRLGLALNPAVVGGLLVAMAAVVAGPGAAAYGLFVLAAVARVADIVLSDGATRTSVNAAFQVVPIRDRLAVQTVVEGIGVPVAIGATGVVLLAINLLGLGIGAVIALGVLLGVLWTVSGAVLYRSYLRALADQMRRSPLGESRAAVAEDDTALQALLRSDDARDVRLGLDLLQGVASTASTPALRHASEHPDPAVRVQALLYLADGGDAEAGAAVTRLARELAASADPAERCAAAAALGSSAADADRRELLVILLDDADPAVRATALDAVRPDDAHDGEIVRRAVAAVEVPRTAGSAAAALRRLGGPAVPLIRAALAREPSPRPALVRAAAHAASGNGLGVIEPALRSGDRVVVLSALDAMEAVANAGIVPRDLLDAVLDDAAAHAGRALAALGSLTDDDGALRRALEDEVDLARRLVIGVLALRHGARVRDAARVVEVAEGQRRALGIEALDVLLTRDEADLAIPLVRLELTAERLAAALKHVVPTGRPREHWVADLADDPDGAWRSPWLALCARHATGG